MQIRKTYHKVKPELLFDELKDLIIKQRVAVDKFSMETYSLPDDSSSFISRGTLTFKTLPRPNRPAEECIRGHIVGSARGETRLMLDIDENLFPKEKVAVIEDDLDFMLGSYEVK